MRRCSVQTCNKKMREGFVIDGGREHYCSEKCLYSKYTEEDYLVMYADGEGETYYTDWEDEEEEDDDEEN